MKSIYRCLLVLICVVFATLPNFARAQEGTPESENQLLYNQPKTGQIDDQTVETEWHFIPVSKDRISVTVERTDGTLAPTVKIYREDAPDKIIATADKDSTFSKATIRELLITQPGQYVAVVSRYKGKDGKSSGGYKVTVGLLGLGADSGTFQLIQGMLKLDTARQGELNSKRWQDTWAFTITTTNPVTITAKRAAGTLVPALKLLDAKQKELATAQADDPFTTAVIQAYTPSAPGQYIVTVMRDGGTDGGTTGDYELIITQGSP